MQEVQIPILSGEELTSLIPQKFPIVMVDTLWYHDETTTVSGFTIKEENIFCSNGFFREPGIVENIAQTAAVRMGYIFSVLVKEGNPVTPPLGYIAAIKNLEIYQLPTVGSELKTEVIIKQKVFDITIIGGKTTVDGVVVAECEMKIFLKKD